MIEFLVNLWHDEIWWRHDFAALLAITAFCAAVLVAIFGGKERL